MKANKLLKKLNKLAGLGKDADKEEVSKLRGVLKALKEKQVKLHEKLERVEGEHERRKINQQIEVIKLQREKGVEVYRTLKEERNES